MNELPSFFHSVMNVWRDIALALGISAISGTVAHLHKSRGAHPVAFSLATLVVDLGSAGLVGFFALMLCIENHVSPFLTGPIVGVASHAAPSLIFLGDKWIVGVFNKKLGVSDDDSEA